MRDTSLLAYDEITTSGRINEMQLSVLRGLAAHGPCTAVELTDRMRDERKASLSFHKRLSELERAGAVRIVQKRPCKETGRMAIEWDVVTTPWWRVPKNPGAPKVVRVALTKELKRDALLELRKLAKQVNLAPSLVELGRWLRDQTESK